MSERYEVVVQGSAEGPAFREFLYSQVAVNNRNDLEGRRDPGSMACTMNEKAESLLREPQPAERIVLVGYEGKQTPNIQGAIKYFQDCPCRAQ